MTQAAFMAIMAETIATLRRHGVETFVLAVLDDMTPKDDPDRAEVRLRSAVYGPDDVTREAVARVAVAQLQGELEYQEAHAVRLTSPYAREVVHRDFVPDLTPDTEGG